MHPKISIKLQNHKIQKKNSKIHGRLSGKVYYTLLEYLELKTLNYTWEIEKQKK